MSSSAQVKYCHACGNPLDPRAELCPRCGVRQAVAPAAAYGVGQRSRLAAALLAIFLGGLGVHKFYTGKLAMGILYLLLCWTFIPAVVGFIEGILYLTMSDEAFWAKYPVR
jgi:TM2 domain-containing membrane protein YozV